MKNLPARERPKRRNPAPYTTKDKVPYKYPKWVTEHDTPPKEILNALLYTYRAGEGGATV